MSIEKAREILTASCDKWIAKGGTIAAGGWRFSMPRHDGDIEECACAMGTLPCGDKVGPDVYRECASLLGCDVANVSAFVGGFDTGYFYANPSPWVALGAEFRARYITKAAA